MKTMDRTQGVRVFEEDCICCCKEKLDSKTREAAAAAAAGGKGWWMRAYLSDAGSHAPLSHAASRSRVSSRLSFILFAVSRLDSRAAAAVVVSASLDQATCAAASLAHRETDTGCSRLLARGSRVHCLPSASLVPSFGTRLLLQSLLRSTADFARCVLRCFLGIRSRGSKACFRETHLRLLLLLRAICLHPRQLICW